MPNTSHHVVTWNDVLEYLKKTPEHQLKQRAMLLPPTVDGDKPILLGSAIALCTIIGLGLKDDDTRGCEDFKHHPEQLVMLYDDSPFDEDGNTAYELVEGGFIGNKTGKLYTLPPGCPEGEKDDS